MHIAPIHAPSRQAPPDRTLAGLEPGFEPGGEPLDRVVVHLSGRLVYSVLPRLQGVLRMVEQEPGLLLDVDLSGVEFIDSGGVSLLLTLQHAVLQGGGDIRFAGVGSRVRRALDRTGAAVLILDSGLANFAN